MSNSITGYGPSRRLIFDGDERKYELWEVKFLGYLRLKKLQKIIVTPLAADASAETRTEDATKNADAFAELIQCLDDRSLSLIIRDAQDDGRKALAILREHYKSKGKPRVITLYTELTTLKKMPEENVTDYMLRGETAATSLKSAGENISDSLLIAMILKGLPSTEFKPFSTVITQKDKEVSFSEFKVALRSFEETQKMSHDTEKQDSVMKAFGKPFQPKKEGRMQGMVCYGCGKAGHKVAECQTKKRWCDICRNNTHDTGYCRKKKHPTKTVRDTYSSSSNNSNLHEDDEHAFAFKVGIDTNNVIVEDGLLVDCGATTHIIHDLDKFIRFDHSFNPENHFIELADGSRSNNVALNRGDARVEITDVNGNTHNAILKDALYVPSYKLNIFSVQAAIEKGSTVNFSPNDAKLVYPDGTEFQIEKSGKLYYLNSAFSSTMTKQNSPSKSLKYWHEILGHCHLNDILLLENVVNGMHISDKTQFDCEACVMGKMTQQTNKKADKRAEKVFDLVHCDLAGPIDPVSKNGFKYAFSFIDDYSGIIMVYFLKQKSDTVRALETFLADSSPYGKVKRLRSDNGTEFISDSFKQILIKHTIKHETSAPYSPHQNGTIERSWRTIFEMARCLLIESSLPKQLWPYAVMSSVYIRNRCYNHRLKKTPYEVITGQKPNLANMHIFGTTCYAFEQNTKKLDPRSNKGIFLGYDKGSPAYLVYFPEKHTVKKYRCVKFTDKFKTTEKETETITSDDDDHEEIVPQQIEQSINEENQPEVSDQNASQAAIDRYPKRTCDKPQYYGQSVKENISENDDSINFTIDYFYKISGVPSSYHEAKSSPDCDKWQKAMEEEMHALKTNNTFELVKIPNNRKVVGGKWVYALKSGQNSQERFKARFVAKGYSQVPGTDYHETFSPTARMTSIRILMQLAVQYNLTMHQMDVKTAYLNAPIDCELYVEQPEGFTVSNKDSEQLVYKLRKSLYGLKQSGRNWNGVLHSYLISEGFIQSQSDTCVYTKVTDKSMTILIIWVDDIIVASNCKDTLTTVKTNLGRRFKMKDMGILSHFLGIDFLCEKGSIKMSQSKYIEKILQRFQMEDCKPRPTPCEVPSGKCTAEDNAESVDSRLYREIVGSLVYVMTATRPDLSYSVTKLSQHLANPTISNMTMAKHVLRYLKGTINKYVSFRRSEEPLRLISYCDADWGGCNDRKSITGYCFMLTRNGPLISWKSRKQPTVALSTCEAEYMSLCSAVQEAKFLSQLLKDLLGGDNFNSVTLFCDNQGAISLSKNPVHHNRSKHIDIRYHFVRSEIQNNFLDLRYISTHDNLADIFTKAVPGPKLKSFIPLLLEM